jgi:hypothetical protein
LIFQKTLKKEFIFWGTYMLKKRYIALLCLLSTILELIFRNPIVSIVISAVLLIVFFYTIYPTKSIDIIPKVICGENICFSTGYAVETIINGTIPGVGVIVIFFLMQIAYFFSLGVLADSDEEVEYVYSSRKYAVISVVIQMIYKFVNFFIISSLFYISNEDMVIEALLNYLVFDLVGGGIVYIISLGILSTQINKLAKLANLANLASAINGSVIPAIIINTQFFSMLYVILNIIFNFV